MILFLIVLHLSSLHHIFNTIHKHVLPPFPHTPDPPRLAGVHEWLKPAEEARHLLENVAFAAVGPCWLANHPGEEECLFVQGEQGAAGAHVAVGIGLSNGAAHFIGNEIRVCLQTLRQAVVGQVVKGEWALELHALHGVFPACDHSRQLSSHQDALCKVPFRHTGSSHSFLKDHAVTELNHSQVILRATFHVTRVDMNDFYIQCLLSIFVGGLTLA